MIAATSRRSATLSATRLLAANWKRRPQPNPGNPLRRRLSGFEQEKFTLTAETLFDDKIRRSRLPIPYSSTIVPPEEALYSSQSKKISVIGCGQVGLACAYAILNQEIAGTLALVDMNGSKLAGEAKDMNQGSLFRNRVDILASTEYGVTAKSNLVIITAGAAQQPGESRLSLVDKNVSILKNVVPRVLESSPDAAVMILSNPCDIMTAVAAKIAGPRVPPGRIFSAGTVLDSGRLCTLVANSLNIQTSSVYGYVVGEHGDSSVPVFSSFRVGGIPLLPPGQAPTETHLAMHKSVVNSAYDVIEKKGYTNWAIGMSSAHIAKAVVDDQRSVMPVGTCVRGFLGIEEDVYMSLPCAVGARGIERVIELPMTNQEEEMFRLSAKKIWDTQKKVWSDLIANDFI